MDWRPRCAPWLSAPLSRRQSTLTELRLPESVEIALYYVAAEALANVAKYAGATNVEIALTAADGRATLCVTDDGVGGADPENGSGLSGLSDRLGAIGGSLSVSSDRGTGTTLSPSHPSSDAVGLSTRDGSAQP